MKVLAPEHPGFASVEIIPATLTHWCEYDRRPKSGRTIAACGAWAEPYELSIDPSCPDCHRLANTSGEEMFGASTSNVVVQSPRAKDDYFAIAVAGLRKAQRAISDEDQTNCRPGTPFYYPK